MTRHLLVAARVAVAAPLCAATATMLLIAVGERAGASPLAGLVTRNSAEAAAWGRAGEMLRFLRSGEDPRQVHDLRPEIVSSAVGRATTLEASIWSRQLELVQLLDQAAAFDQAERASLACLAADLDIEDVVEYLAPGGTSRCEAGQALDRVMARSR
jgi:hypothetical protein